MGIRKLKAPSSQLYISMILFLFVCLALLFILGQTPIGATAQPMYTFGPACGRATVDGHVETDEWSDASTQTFQMDDPDGTDPFTATLKVMNSANYLYLGITINDDELSPIGKYLPKGDGFRIDFDNDHSGSLFALEDDVLSINAGLPQFEDSFIVNSQFSSAWPDEMGGGTSDGFGAATRAENLNHFEVKHPLCSGDSLDFCLHTEDVVGFRLEYLDAQANGDFGGSQFFPGHSETSMAEIVIGNCLLPDRFFFLPLIEKK